MGIHKQNHLVNNIYGHFMVIWGSDKSAILQLSQHLKDSYLTCSKFSYHRKENLCHKTESGKFVLSCSGQFLPSLRADLWALVSHSVSSHTDTGHLYTQTHSSNQALQAHFKKVVSQLSPSLVEYGRLQGHHSYFTLAASNSDTNYQPIPCSLYTCILSSSSNHSSVVYSGSLCSLKIQRVETTCTQPYNLKVTFPATFYQGKSHLRHK